MAEHFLDFITSDIDRKWAGYRPSADPYRTNPYYDYFFSGQDVRIFVDGTFEEPEFFTLPINQFGFNISQKKMPIYGFWSYTYDGVMRGVRIIEGSFVLVTKSPDYMRRLLEKAADTRAKNGGSYSYFKGLTEDDKRIDQYWGKNLDPAIASAGKNVFSVHPPFSFIIVYGIQSTSINDFASSQSIDDSQQVFFHDSLLMADVNDRLVDAALPITSRRIVLDSCELTGMSTGYTSDGSAIMETYNFIARDIII